MTYAAITGWGSCMPPAVLSNDDLSTFLDTSDDWIRSRTGMRERRVSHVSATELATLAAKRALACADLDPTELDLIVYGGVSNEELCPNSASGVQISLGASRAASMDLNTACTSFCYGLAVATGMIRTGQIRNAARRYRLPVFEGAAAFRGRVGVARDGMVDETVHELVPIQQCHRCGERWNAEHEVVGSVQGVDHPGQRRSAVVIAVLFGDDVCAGEVLLDSIKDDTFGFYISLCTKVRRARLVGQLELLSEVAGNHAAGTPNGGLQRFEIDVSRIRLRHW